MAKKRFNIPPKLDDNSKKIKPLPVQKISVEEIEKIAIGSETKASKPKIEEPKLTPSKKKKEQKINVSKTTKLKQGRPRRTEPVKRLSSDLPVELYDRLKQEVKDNGYTMNGFLAKVLKEYFKNKGSD